MISVGERISFVQEATLFSGQEPFEIDKNDQKLNPLAAANAPSMTRPDFSAERVDQIIPLAENALQPDARFLELRLRYLAEYQALDQARFRQRQILADISYADFEDNELNPAVRLQLRGTTEQIREAEARLLNALQEGLTWSVRQERYSGAVKSFYNNEISHIDRIRTHSTTDQGQVWIQFYREIEGAQAALERAQNELERASRLDFSAQEISFLQREIQVARETLASLLIQQREWVRAALPYNFDNTADSSAERILLYQNGINAEPDGSQRALNYVNNRWFKPNAEFIRQTCDQAFLSLPLDRNNHADFITQAMGRIIPESLRNNLRYGANFRSLRETALRRLSGIATPTYNVACDIVRDLVVEAIQGSQNSQNRLRGPVTLLLPREELDLLEDQARLESLTRAAFVRAWLEMPVRPTR
ncbi:MAG: hypothetical protein ABH859_01875 [Pseudomonadota bacterium]